MSETSAVEAVWQSAGPSGSGGSSGREARAAPKVYDNAPRHVLLTVIDGRVTLAGDLDLSQLRALPLPYLYAVREMVNTAIYDAEKGG